MRDTMDKIDKLMAEMRLDIEKVFRGNYVSGTRVRKQCKQIMNHCKTIRAGVIEARDIQGIRAPSNRR